MSETKTPRTQFLKMEDGTQIAYRVFQPADAKDAKATPLLMIQGLSAVKEDVSVNVQLRLISACAVGRLGNAAGSRTPSVGSRQPRDWRKRLASARVVDPANGACRCLLSVSHLSCDLQALDALTVAKHVFGNRKLNVMGIS